MMLQSNGKAATILSNHRLAAGLNSFLVHHWHGSVDQTEVFTDALGRQNCCAQDVSRNLTMMSGR